MNPVACDYARRNAEAAGLGDCVEVRDGTLTTCSTTRERFALVIADPPWVRRAEVGRFPEDPLLAIDGGDDGLDAGADLSSRWRGGTCCPAASAAPARHRRAGRRAGGSGRRSTSSRSGRYERGVVARLDRRQGRDFAGSTLWVPSHHGGSADLPHRHTAVTGRVVRAPRRRRPRRRGRPAAASARRGRGRRRGARTSATSLMRGSPLRRAGVRAHAVLEVQAGEGAEQDVVGSRPGSSSSEAAADDAHGELLVHRVRLDVLGVVVDQLGREAEALQPLRPSGATAASWSPRTRRGGRGRRRAAAGAARTGTSRCSARGSRAAPRRRRRRTPDRSPLASMPRANRWACSRFGSPAPYSSYCSSISAALGATGSRGHHPRGRVGLLEVVDRAQPQQVEHLLPVGVALHVRRQRRPVVAGDVVEERLGEGRRRLGAPVAGPAAGASRSRSSARRSAEQAGCHSSASSTSSKPR